MEEPLSRERPRDRVAEAFLLARKAGISDPLGLPCAVFDRLLLLVGKGELVRAGEETDPCRSYVEAWLQQGDA
jgi:hypothetical protein